MTILIVTVDFPPHTDGVSTVAHELASRLQDAGEDIVVIGPQSRNDPEYDSKQKFKVVRTPLYEWGYLRFIPIFFVMLFVIIKYKIKKVIAMNIAYGGLISYIFFKFLGFSYILWAYGYEFAKFKDNAVIKRLYLKIYENSLYVTAISNFVREQLIKFGVDPAKIVVIKPGTDPLKYYPVKVNSDFIREHNLENKRIIMSVGRLIERKGIDMALKALKDVIKEYPDVIYLIIGEGPYKKELGVLSQELGVKDFVRFMGRVNDKELLHFYNLCDLFIMPSRSIDKKGDIEGFGIVFLEAGACEKPVIGGLDGGMGEAIDNGVTGLLINSLDTKEIFSAIIKVLSDRNFAAFLGKNARRRVIEELNWERTVQKFYKQMLAHCS